MSQVKVRMDKSRYFSTVHGDRGPDDPLVRVHFYQDGLPFDAQGLLVPECVPANDKELQDKMARLIKKAKPVKEKPAPETPPAGDPPTGTGDGPEADDDDDDAGGQSDPNDVNLEAWLRGEQKYPWFAITKAIRTRYAKNVTKTEDAVQFLVNEQAVVAKENLAAIFQPMLG